MQARVTRNIDELPPSKIEQATTRASARPRRRQRGQERREMLLQALRAVHEAVPSHALAQHLGVSRQVVVQDVTILRAHGCDILSTRQGYLLQDVQSVGEEAVVHVRHGRDGLLEEAQILVDLGIHILDERIEHPVYGSLRGELRLSSRQDAHDLVERLERTGTGLLSEVVAGQHSHQVRAPRPELLEKARQQLRQHGYLTE